MRRTCY